jgi:SsrA-binding protein
MSDIKIISKNKKAFFDYEIIDKFEAGIMLQGSEVKSLRLGNVNLKGSYVVITENAALISGMHIGFYEHSNIKDYDPLARRKLLLNSKEIDKLRRAENDSGLAIIPLDIYFKKGLVKLTIAIAKGKKTRDKRQTIKTREQNIQINRELRNYR